MWGSASLCLALHPALCCPLANLPKELRRALEMGMAAKAHCASRTQGGAQWDIFYGHQGIFTKKEQPKDSHPLESLEKAPSRVWGKVSSTTLSGQQELSAQGRGLLFKRHCG